MGIRSFGESSFEYYELWCQESDLLGEILNLSEDVDRTAALGTDKEFADAQANLAAAEERLSGVQERLLAVGEEMEPWFY